MDDRFGNFNPDVAITLTDCIKVATAQSSTPPPAFQPTDTRPAEFVNYISQFRPIAHYPLTTNAQDTTRNSPYIALKDMQYHHGALYRAGGHQKNTTGVLPTNWNLNLYTNRAELYVNELEQDMPVSVSGRRRIGFYLNKNGPASMMFNNPNFVHSNLRDSTNTWHETCPFLPRPECVVLSRLCICR